MVNYDRVAKKAFNIIKGYGYNVMMYDVAGNETVDPELGRRFYVDDPNMMLTIDDEEGEMSLSKNSLVELDLYKDVLVQLRGLANRYMMNFNLRNHGKEIKPRDFSYQATKHRGSEMNEGKFTKKLRKKAYDTWFGDNFGRGNDPKSIATRIKAADSDFLERLVNLGHFEGDPKPNSPAQIQYRLAKRELAKRAKRENNMDQVQESSLSRMTGSKKTSYQTLESVRILVKHKKPVDEGVRGSRTRNIHSIFLEQSGERFRFPHNHLGGARAMARHLQCGGSVADTVGTHIVENAGNYIKLREFMRYVQSNKLINEDSESVVKLVRENMQQLANGIRRLSGAKSYSIASARIQEQVAQELDEQSVNELRDMFTVRKFNEKMDDVLPIVGRMVQERDNYMQRIEEAAGGDIYLTPQVVSDMNSVLEFSSKQAKIGNQLQEMSLRIKENKELSEFIASLGNKIISEQELTMFESSIMKAFFENAQIEKLEEDKPESIIEECVKSLNDKLVSLEPVFI